MEFSSLKRGATQGAEFTPLSHALVGGRLGSVKGQPTNPHLTDPTNERPSDPTDGQPTVSTGDPLFRGCRIHFRPWFVLVPRFWARFRGASLWS